MARGDRRKCKCCLKLFRPDPRNRRYQRYSSRRRRRAASKAGGQAMACQRTSMRWLGASEQRGNNGNRRWQLPGLSARRLSTAGLQVQEISDPLIPITSRRSNSCTFDQQFSYDLLELFFRMARASFSASFQRARNFCVSFLLRRSMALTRAMCSVSSFLSRKERGSHPSWNSRR